MDTRQFFARVAPGLDEVVLCTHKPDPTGVNPLGFFWNRGSFADLDAMAAAAQQWDAEPTTTVYYTIGAFAGHKTVNASGNPKYFRTQNHATWFKTLALDLDIGAGKPYATKAEGMRVMAAALTAIGMPDPMIVSSGNGVHLYWPLTQTISTAHWEKASIALRVALGEHGVVIDTTKIHDPSMVLRPVGTHHKKQQPWKDVKCVADCPDYDPITLLTILKPWFGKGATSTKRVGSGKKSAIAAAILNSNDIVIDVVASRCRQIGALAASGGVTDAAGSPVQEPMWRVSVGFAGHCTDVNDAITKLAGKHPDFNLQVSLDKLRGWKATGPTTCAKFEQMCPTGCDGCPSKGKITSPAQLSAATAVEVVTPAGEEVVMTLPPGYVVQNGQIFREIKTETSTTDANGNEVAQDVVEFDLVSPYEMHVTGVYNDPVSNRSAFRLIVKYPMSGWKEESHEMPVLGSIGKDFSTFLLNRQVYMKHVGQQEKLRSYLMDYLTMVQKEAPSGVDFVSFGWQEDGSFMCGQTILGSPSGATDLRLRGAAASFADKIGPHGSRDEWVRGMELLNHPGSENIRAAVLFGTVGILGPAVGNATMLVSYFSPETTTGKTLALIASNSLIGHPKKLFLSQQDTTNALFKLRGTFNHLPCSIDEMTSAEDATMTDMAYILSSGRERITLTRDRDVREPATWNAPTQISTNISLYGKFENAQAGSDPLKARCLEFPQNDRTFISTKVNGVNVGYLLYDLLLENNGWALPEIVQVVQDKGGPAAVWKWAEASFEKTFGFVFEPQERFYRTGIICAWGLGRIGQGLGLFPFDIKSTIEHMLAAVLRTRKQAIDNRVDAFDIIGLFLADHNDQLVQSREKYGSKIENVHLPAPERAVARVSIVYDDQNPVMPGSCVSINAERLKMWLRSKRDSIDRVESELDTANVVIRRRDRVTIFKGCPKHAPGQMQCLVLNLNHPRFVDTLSGTHARAQSRVTLAVLQGAA